MVSQSARVLGGINRSGRSFVRGREGKEREISEDNGNEKERSDLES